MSLASYEWFNGAPKADNPRQVPGARIARLNFVYEASTAGHYVVQFVHTNQRSKGFSSWVIALLLFCPMTKPAPGRMIPSWAQKLRRP